MIDLKQLSIRELKGLLENLEEDLQNANDADEFMRILKDESRVCKELKRRKNWIKKFLPRTCRVYMERILDYYDPI